MGGQSEGLGGVLCHSPSHVTRREREREREREGGGGGALSVRADHYLHEISRQD